MPRSVNRDLASPDAVPRPEYERPVDQIRCAVQVPEHGPPCQVPDPEVADRRPKPTARFTPLARVTLILPASATRPDAVIIALFDATWPLLIPIETLVPLLQAGLFEPIRTFHSPSNVAAAAGVATDIPASSSMCEAIMILRKWFMTSSCDPMRSSSHIGWARTVMAVTPVVQGTI